MTYLRDNLLKPLTRFIFWSRWLQAPIYVGLIVAQILYCYKFAREVAHLVGMTETSSEVSVTIESRATRGPHLRLRVDDTASDDLVGATIDRACRGWRALEAAATGEAAPLFEGKATGGGGS